MKAVFQCRATDDLECPDFFAIDLTESLMRRIKTRARKCVDEISHIALHFYDGIWESEDFHNEFMLGKGELVVSAERIWFNIYPEKGWGQIQTVPQQISTLREALDSRRGLVFFGDNQEHLQESYSDYMQDY